MRLARMCGVPFASEALRFIESIRRQQVCSSVAIADRRLSRLAGTS